MCERGMKMQVQKVSNNNNNTSFNAHLMCNKMKYPRLRTISEKFEEATKQFPHDCLDTSSPGFMQYYQYNNDYSILIEFDNKDTFDNILDVLLRENDKTVVEKLKKLFNVSREVFKTDKEVKKRIENNDRLIKKINNLIPAQNSVYSNAYDTIAEFIAFKTLKNDPLLNNLSLLKIQPLSRKFTGFRSYDVNF